MKLSPARFNAFLGDIGQQFLWRRAYACPNINPHSGAGDFNCPTCDGKGWFWPGDPVPAVAGVPNQSVQRKFLGPGLVEQGDLIITIGSDSPLYGLGPMDRVAAVNSRTRFSMTLTRGLGDTLDRVEPTVERVFWLKDDKETIVEGGIPAIADDGTLTWQTGEPPDGTPYSISGSAVNEYFVFTDLPENRKEHSGANLPRKAHLRRIDLFGR